MSNAISQVQFVNTDQLPAQSQQRAIRQVEQTPVRLVSVKPEQPLRTILPLKQAVQEAMLRTG